MALIKINNDFAVNGRMTVKRRKDKEGNIVTEGTLATHHYLEEINEIETFRYKVFGVDVVEESFGSDDFDIVYSFTAEHIENVYGPTNMSSNQISEIEKRIYGADGFVIGTILEEVVKGEE